VDPLGVVLVVAFGVFAVADWRAVWRNDQRQRTLTKPSATVALIAIAALAGDMDSGARTVLVLAVLLCLAGDIALLDDSSRRFLVGLGSFALGHVAYVVTGLMVGVAWPRLAIALPLLVVLFTFQLATRMLPAAARHGGANLAAAVSGYSVVISAMVVTAVGTGSWSAGIGATLFAVSDSMIAYNRFVRPFPLADLAVMVTYHGGQLLLVLGLIATG